MVRRRAKLWDGSIQTPDLPRVSNSSRTEDLKNCTTFGWYESSLGNLKVKISVVLCLTKYYAMETYWGMEV
jgi:hypothetical protein